MKNLNIKVEERFINIETVLFDKECEEWIALKKDTLKLLRKEKMLEKERRTSI